MAPPRNPYMSQILEEQIERSIFSNKAEKTFIDKILAKDDVSSARNIIKKPVLSREDMIDLLNLLSSNENKLLNYGPWDRYIFAKLFTWIREFIAMCEQMYDIEDDLNQKQKAGLVNITPRTRQIFDNNMRLMQHNIKFLVDLYFNVTRSTLSLGATGFLETLKNKFEISYPESGGGLRSPVTQQGVAGR